MYPRLRSLLLICMLIYIVAWLLSRSVACAQSMMMTTTTTNKVNDNNAAAVVYREAKRLFSAVGTAAVMGNIDVETGGTFDYQQKQKNGGPGYGLFQMEKPMRADYDRWRHNKKKKKDSSNSQLEYVQYQITQGGTYIGTKSARIIQDAFAGSNVDRATIEFCNRFERPGIPHMERRLESARKWYHHQHDHPRDRSSKSDDGGEL